MYNLNDENPVSSKAPEDFKVTDISVPATPESPKKETYKYKIPEGYTLPKQVLMEKKEGS